MLSLKYNAAYKFNQKIQLLLPQNKTPRQQISYLNSIVARFNSNNIVFRYHNNAYFRDRIELWWKSKQEDTIVFCSSLNDGNCKSLDDMILKLVEWCKMMKIAIHENERWFLSCISFDSCRVEEGELKFLDIVSRFNGSSMEQFEMFLDMMEITQA